MPALPLTAILQSLSILASTLMLSMRLLTPSRSLENIAVPSVIVTWSIDESLCVGLAGGMPGAGTTPWVAAMRSRSSGIWDGRVDNRELGDLRMARPQAGKGPVGLGAADGQALAGVALVADPQA